MTEELKALPCPCCGSNADSYLNDSSDYKCQHYGVVTCMQDGCGLSIQAESEAEALAAWNRRATLRPIDNGVSK